MRHSLNQKNNALKELDFYILKQIKWKEIANNALYILQEPRSSEAIIYSTYNDLFGLMYSWQIVAKKTPSDTSFGIVKQTWDYPRDKNMFDELLKESDIEKYTQRVRTKALEDFLRPKIYSFYLNPFQPTIIKQKYSITEDLFYSYWKAAKELNLLAFPKLSFGLDGTTCSFSIRNGDLGTTYQWWEDLPKEWKTIQPFIDLMTKY